MPLATDFMLLSTLTIVPVTEISFLSSSLVHWPARACSKHTKLLAHLRLSRRVSISAHARRRLAIRPLNLTCSAFIRVHFRSVAMGEGGMGKRFLLLYGSQTGQAEAIAERIRDLACERGFKPDIHCISQSEKKV